MLTPKLQMLQRTLKRLMRRGASGSLERVLAKTHAADLAFILEDLQPAERRQLVEQCPGEEKQAAVIGAAGAEIAADVLAAIARQRAVTLLQHIEPDDRHDILESMDPEVAAELLEQMRGADRREVEELSRYEPTTAGGIMSPRFFALHRDKTAAEAIAELQQDQDALEMVFYVYVVNEVGQLLGVLSLRQLVTTRPNTTLFEMMTSELITVTPEVDQEEVAKLASRYGLLAVPVVDASNKLLGIVTVDDVIDVLREEATEDILRMAGAEGQLGPQSVLSSVISRMRWLLATGLTGSISALIVGAYVGVLTSYLPLIYFVPLVLGLAGVTALQSAAIITQNLLQGRATLGLATRQIGAGIVLGLVCGALAGSFGWFWWGGPAGSANTAVLVIGAGISAAVSCAATLGSLMPVLFSRMRLDPSLASGPVVAIAADLAGLWLYLRISSGLL